MRIFQGLNKTNNSCLVQPTRLEHLQCRSRISFRTHSRLSLAARLLPWRTTEQQNTTYKWFMFMTEVDSDVHLFTGSTPDCTWSAKHSIRVFFGGERDKNGISHSSGVNSQFSSTCFIVPVLPEAREEHSSLRRRQVPFGSRKASWFIWIFEFMIPFFFLFQVFFCVINVECKDRN